MVTSTASAVRQNTQSFDRQHAFDNAASIDFVPNTAVAHNLQSSPFENLSIYQNTNFEKDFTSTMATTIATTVANAITSTSVNNSFRLPELIPMVCDNGEGHYIPKAFADRLACAESLLTETPRELKLEQQNNHLLEET